MEGPRARARIGGRFRPSSRGQDVGAAVFVDVTRADAVAVTLRRDDVLDPASGLGLVPRERRLRRSSLREDFLGLAVVVEIREQCELDREARVDFRLGPHPPRLARILPPGDLLREPRDRHDVGIAVSVHVDGKVAEIVDVVVREVELPERMPGPCGSFVPVVSGHDVETAVMVDVRNRGRFARPAIEHADPERDIGRPRRRDRQQPAGRHQHDRRDPANHRHNHPHEMPALRRPLDREPTPATAGLQTVFRSRAPF